MPLIEKTVEKLSRRLDEAYREGQVLFDEYNPCEIVLHECGGATCVAKDKPGQVCCVGCDHHSYDGCTIMCLGCKLALCGSAGEHEEFREKLDSIIRAIPNYFPYLSRIRMPKDETLKELSESLRRKEAAYEKDRVCSNNGNDHHKYFARICW